MQTSRDVITTNLSDPNTFKGNPAAEDKAKKDRRIADEFWSEAYKKSSGGFNPEVYDIFKKWAGKIEDLGEGACDEYSLIVLDYLFNKIANDKNFSMLDAEIVTVDNGDHTFVRLFVKSQELEQKAHSSKINTDDSDSDDEEYQAPKDWWDSPKDLENSVIVDAWVDVDQTFLADDIPKKLVKYKKGESVLCNEGLKVSVLQTSLALKEKPAAESAQQTVDQAFFDKSLTDKKRDGTQAALSTQESPTAKVGSTSQGPSTKAIQ